MEIIGPAPETLTNGEIVKKYDDLLTKLIKLAADPQYDSERQHQVNQAKANWRMVQGSHFNVPDFVDSGYGVIADWVDVAGTDDKDKGGAAASLTPPLNVIGADCWKFSAVMGQNAPRVKAVADDPQDIESLEAAHTADVNIRDLWIKNLVDRKWKALAFHQYTTGPCYIRGVWNTDARKYGHSSEPQIQIQQSADGLPVPVQAGEPMVYANGDAELKIYSLLEVSTPFDAKELGGWLKCEVIVPKWSLLEMYAAADDGSPGPLEQYRDGDVPDDDMGAASTTALEAADAVTLPSGTGRARKPNCWRHSEVFLDPWYFEAIQDPKVRGIFKRQFADGLYIARAGSVTCRIDNRRMTDEWAVCKVGRGERINERPICADSVPINRAVNDLIGMSLETVLRAISQTVIDNQLLDRESMKNKEAIPGELIFTAIPVDGDLSKRIFPIPPARLSDQVLPLLERMVTAMRDGSGVRPELSGGGQPTQTFREAKQRRDQALLQLAPQADEERFAAESIAEILIKLRSKFGTGTVKAQRQGAYGMETDVVDMADLKEGGWHCASDDKFPITLSDRRDSVFSLLKDFSPEVQAALSILDPLNVGELLELLQVPGFESQIQDQKQKTLADIAQLLQGQPIPGTPGPNGAAGPPQPSITADPYDDHALAAKVFASWLISKTGQKQKNLNPNGFANVEAMYQSQMQLAKPPQPPPPPPLKGTLGLTGRLEDFPQLMSEVMVGAGLPAPAPAPPQPQLAAPAPAGAPPDMSHPQPIGGPEKQEVPIPPLGPAGHGVQAVQ